MVTPESHNLENGSQSSSKFDSWSRHIDFQQISHLQFIQLKFVNSPLSGFFKYGIRKVRSFPLALGARNPWFESKMPYNF